MKRTSDFSRKMRWLFVVFSAILSPLLMRPDSVRAEEKTLLDVWSEIKTPPPVAVQSVSLDPTSSTLLILDIEEWACNKERRPRCPDSVPRIKDFSTGHRPER